MTVFLGSVGIILEKSHMSKYKITILDKVQGKIECVSTAQSFSIGTLITYNLNKQKSAYFISDTTLLYSPLSLARTDMLFFHHVLELICYFTQVGNCATEVFDLLAFLYSTEHAAMTELYKKFFLLKLLTCMGSVPELNNARADVITQLNTIDIKQLNTMTISTTDEKLLDRWLWCCVWQHPYVNKFKTVHFLAKNRAI